jgi:signal transduction histidine kinase/ActR/RegA family two-component response regulator
MAPSLSRLLNLRPGVATLSSWREAILRAGLASFATALIAGTSSFLLIARPSPVPHFVWVLYGTGVFHLVLLFVGRGPTSGRSLSFVASAAVAFGSLGISYGWVPAYQVGSLSVAVMAGLLLGRRAAYLTIGLAPLTCWAGALGLQGGHFTFSTDPYHPGVYQHWVQVAIVFFIGIGSMVMALLRVLPVVESAREQAERSLEEARRELANADEARRRRLDMDRAFRHSQRLQIVSQLGRGLAQLFNNGITVMLGCVDELRRAGSQEAVSDTAARLMRTVKKAAQTAVDLLVFGREPAGDPRPVLLREELAAKGKVLRSALRDDIQLSISHEGPAATVRIDPVQLNQLLLNLALNSRDAMPEGGRLSIVSGIRSLDATYPSVDPLARGEYVAIAVRDTGHGMDDDTLARACEPFFTTRKSGRNQGLGLWVCLGIAQQAGGSLALRAAPDLGTEITVLIPAFDAEGARCAGAPPGPPSAGAAPAAESPSTAPLAPGGTAEVAAGATAEEGQTRPRPAAEPRARGSESGPGPGASPMSAWRELYLRRTMRVALVAFSPALVIAYLLIPEHSRAGTEGAIAACGIALALLAFATLAPRATHSLRLWTLVVAIGVLSGALLAGWSFMVPSSCLLLGSVVLWATVFGGPRAAVAALVMATGLLALAGRIYVEHGFVETLPVFLPLFVENWVRAGIMLACLLVPLFHSILSVAESAQARVVELERSLAGLAAAREARRAEDEALAQAEERAIRAERLQTAGRVAGGIAHDMGNALQVIMATSELIEMTPSDQGDSIQSQLDHMERALEHTEALIAQLGAESSLRASAAPLELGAALERAVASLRQILPGSVHLEAVTGGEPIWARLRRADLTRILLNLATNARDAMPDGGRLTLRLRRQADHVLVDVEDTGVGMDPSTRGQVFNPFFSTKRPGTGTGLGLYNVKQLAEAGGGALELWSEPGVGTRVTLKWPCSDAPRTRRRAVPVSALDGSRDQKGRGDRGAVLLAEDDHDVRYFMERALRRAGFEVFAAADARAAAELLERASSLDALCVDAVMPGSVSAVELIGRFSARHPGRPVLLCSGYLPEEVASRLASVPRGGYLRKPFGGAELIDALSTAMSQAGDAA